ncbi:MAG: hypothetical protein HUK10_01250 [Bacteroides heparinolyticus]|nr:hypothetical protein [Bacteroides heparinolyticus]
MEESKPNYENWSIEQLSNHLATYIAYKNEIYYLIIHKNDWDGYEDNSWIVYYAKENLKSFSTQKTLIKVTGSSLHKALANMTIAYFQYKSENKKNPNYKWKL